MSIVVRQRNRSRDALAINLTPMVDVIFMLTIFYMLVSTFSSHENKPLDLPTPTDSQAAPIQATEPVVINCQLAEPQGPPDGDVLYSFGPNREEPLASLRERLMEEKSRNPGVKVILRADKRIPFVRVRALMSVLADCRIEVLNVAAQLNEGGGK